jgi:hypothetical protein
MRANLTRQLLLVGCSFAFAFHRCLSAFHFPFRHCPLSPPSSLHRSLHHSLPLLHSFLLIQLHSQNSSLLGARRWILCVLLLAACSAPFAVSSQSSQPALSFHPTKCCSIADSYFKPLSCVICEGQPRASRPWKQQARIENGDANRKEYRCVIEFCWERDNSSESVGPSS